jgi:hypothetical protein
MQFWEKRGKVITCLIRMYPVFPDDTPDMSEKVLRNGGVNPGLKWSPIALSFRPGGTISRKSATVFLGFAQNDL